VTGGRTPDESHTHEPWTAASESNPPATSTQPGRAEVVDQIKQVAVKRPLRSATVGGPSRIVYRVAARSQLAVRTQDSVPEKRGNLSQERIAEPVPAPEREAEIAERPLAATSAGSLRPTVRW
jgi:hypothetical protein